MTFYIQNIKLLCLWLFFKATAQEQQLDCADALDHNGFILVCNYKIAFVQPKTLRFSFFYN